MNQKERKILELEESFRDTIENDIIKQQKENKKIKIKDIKLVGQATWKDKINGKDISENVFIVEKDNTAHTNEEDKCCRQPGILYADVAVEANRNHGCEQQKGLKQIYKWVKARQPYLQEKRVVGA